MTERSAKDYPKNQCHPGFFSAAIDVILDVKTMTSRPGVWCGVCGSLTVKTSDGIVVHTPTRQALNS